MGERTSAMGPMVEVLEAVDTRLDVRQVLYRLVEASVVATGADRCAALIVEDGSLVPVAVASRRPNRDLFRRFKSMPAIPLVTESGVDLSPLVWGSELVVVEDTAQSDIVPGVWIDAFGTTSVAIAPISSAHGIGGIFAVDHTMRHHFDERELDAVRFIGHVARVAVGNASLRRRSDEHEIVRRQLLAATSALNSATDLRTLLGAISRAAADIFPGSSCSISYPSDGGQVVASGDAHASAGHRHVFALRSGGGHQGFLTLVATTALRPDELALLEAIAHQASVALERAELIDELRLRLRRSDVVHRLGELLDRSHDVSAAIARLNAEIGADVSFECVDVAFRQRRYVEHVGGRTLEPDEVGLLARLAIDRQPATTDLDPHGLSVTTIPVNGNAVGLLYVRRRVALVDLGADDQALVDAIAAGLGAVANRAVVEDELRAAKVRLEITRTRHEVAQELEANLGSALRSLVKGLAGEAATAENDAARQRLAGLRQLGVDALGHLHAAAGAESALSLREVSVHDALRGLLRAFEERTGVATTLRIDGQATSLGPDLDLLVHRLVFEALSLVVEPARATTATVAITYGDGVLVSVRDDGIGLSQRGGADSGPGVPFAVSAMRARAEAAGARVEVGAAEPRGAVVTLAFPRAAAVVRGTAPFPRRRRT